MSVLSKVLEKIVLSKLSVHVEQKHLNPFETVYRKGPGTESVNDPLLSDDDDKVSFFALLCGPLDLSKRYGGPPRPKNHFVL